MKNYFQSYYLDSPLNLDRVMDIFEPDADAPVRDMALFFVHGGGWHSGSRTVFHVLMQEFCNLGYYCCTTDYRLSGVNAFDQLSDIREAFDIFVGMLKERNINCRFAVIGSSAGAHLASLMACALPGECGEDVSKLRYPEVRPVKAILQATPYDFKHWEGMMPPFWAQMERAAGGKYADDPERFERLSLCNYIREDNPEIFFIEAGLEHLFPVELTRELARKQRSMNIASCWKVYDRVEHGFFYDLTREMQKAAFKDACSFLEDKLQCDF
jgi:acetyl esterase/lipase